MALATVAGVSLSGPGSGWAQVREPWRFAPSVSVDETWSDNINLNSAGSERSDFVTSVSPSLTLSRRGPWLALDFNYSPQLLYYAHGTNGNTVRNSLNAVAAATLVPNLLTFDAGANVSQQNISPFGTQAADTVNGSTNRAETRSFSFGPTLRSRLDRDLTYSAGYRYITSSAGNSAYAANHSNQLFGSVATSTSFRDLGVGADYNRTEQSYGNASVETQALSGNVTYVVAPTFHLRGNAGYDRNHYTTTGEPDLKGPSYSGGFDWEPSHHTSLNAQVGHRYFGPTANIVLNENTSRVSLSASYVRDQTTSLGSGQALVQDPNYALLDQFYRATITDPVLRAQQVAQSLQQAGLPTSQYGVSSFISNQIYVQKSLNVALALLGLRNTVTFNASRSDSQSLSAITAGFDVFAQAQKFRTTSYSANWSHRLGPRTNANATISKTHNVALAGIGDTRQVQFVTSINRNFQQHLSGSLLYRHSMQTSDSANAGFFSGNYRENAVLGSLRLTY